MQKKIFPIGSLLACGLYASMACAQITQVPVDASDSLFSGWHIYHHFSWQIRATGWGYSGDHTLGKGDVMVPLIGNDAALFFADAQGNAMINRGWLGSVGGGYRQIVRDKAILGINGFVEKDYSPNHNEYWVLSPGIEAIGQRWDLHLNGYFPVSQKRHYISTAFASQLGNFQFITFSGHNQYDHVFSLFDEVGNGVDGEVGFVPPVLNNFHAYVGGYYFAPKDADTIKGVSGKLAYAITHNVALEATDTYDNVFYNTALVGVRITLGGMENDIDPNADIQNRMLDPIQRNIASYSGSASLPQSRTLKDQGPAVQKSQIYFFSATGNNPFNPAIGTANCTAENPCTITGPFSQSIVNSINSFAPGANYYFNGGHFDITSGLSLPGGVSFFGRSLDYVLPAVGGARPLFTGNLILNGNNTVDSIQLVNGLPELSGMTVPATVPGILIKGPLNTLSNSLVGGTGVQAFPMGIDIENANSTFLNGDSINVTSLNPLANNTINGVFINNSNVTIANSTINATENGSASNLSVNGIVANNLSSVSLSHSVVTAAYNSSNGSSLGGGEITVNGIQGAGAIINIGGGSTINANFNEGQNNTFTTETVTVNGISNVGGSTSVDTLQGLVSRINATHQGNATSAFVGVSSFFVNGISVSQGLVTLGGTSFSNGGISTVNAAYTGTNSAEVTGIKADHISTVSAINQVIVASNSDNDNGDNPVATNAFGIRVLNGSTITATNSVIKSFANVNRTVASGQMINEIAVGIEGEGFSQINVNGGSNILADATNNAPATSSTIDVTAAGIGGSLLQLSTTGAIINMNNAIVTALASSTVGSGATGTTAAFGTSITKAGPENGTPILFATNSRISANANTQGGPVPLSFVTQAFTFFKGGLDVVADSTLAPSSGNIFAFNANDTAGGFVVARLQGSPPGLVADYRPGEQKLTQFSLLQEIKQAFKRR